MTDPRVTPLPPEPKVRYVEVTDPDEIAAIQRGERGSPIGDYAFLPSHTPGGVKRIHWFATADSLAQYRQHKFDVRAKFPATA
jgi:hypothetical protein